MADSAVRYAASLEGPGMRLPLFLSRLILPDYKGETAGSLKFGKRSDCVSLVMNCPAEHRILEYYFFNAGLLGSFDSVRYVFVCIEADLFVSAHGRQNGM